MRIGIDLTALLPEATGVDQYLLNLVDGLARVDAANRYVLFANREDRDRLAARVPPRFRVVPCSLRPRGVRLAFQQAGLPALAAALRLDVVHSPAFIMPLWRGRAGHVLNVYDMTFFSMPEHHVRLRRSRPFRAAVLHSIRHADVVSVPSRHVQRDVVAWARVPQDRVRVIPAGVGDEFRPPLADAVRAVRQRLGLPAHYILHVGTIEPRKNLSTLVEAYARLVETEHVDAHLVLAGRRGWKYDRLLARVATPALRDRVHLIGYVPQADLPVVYAAARLFVYPSLEEGFGLPPLEAMACGVPVISSQSSSLLENLDGAAELVPPEDVAALAAAMHRLLADEPLRTSRTTAGLARAARYRWMATAAATIACYTDAARSAVQRRR